MSLSNFKKRIEKLKHKYGIKKPVILMNPTEEEIEEATKQGQKIIIVMMEGLGSKDPHAHA